MSERPRSSPLFSPEDERFMRRALALAERGRGTTRPNPVVGAVIVRKGRIVAEGFHRRAGEPHAEIEALGALRGGGARGTTLYVTLEPCCHYGRTPPCTDALVAAAPRRVVVGARDPNPLVDGEGLSQLRRAGIRVDVGCLEERCQDLNHAYAIWIRERRPMVTLKAAATLDGMIADRARRARRAPVWITGPEARRAAHELRAAHDAVLVGAGTVWADDPRLTVRVPGQRPERPPLRVVLAGRRGLPPRAHVLDGAAPTLVIGGGGSGGFSLGALTGGKESAGRSARSERLPAGRARPGRRTTIARALAMLAGYDVQSVLVEGGATVHSAFIAAGLVDRVAFFVAPALLGGGVPIAAGAGLPVASALRLGPLTTRAVGSDLLITADVRPRARSSGVV